MIYITGRYSILSRPAGRIEGCGPQRGAPFDTRFRSAASLQHYSGCYTALFLRTLRLTMPVSAHIIKLVKGL